MDDFTHIVYAIMPSIDGIPVHRPPDIAVRIHPFHHHPVTALAIGIVIRQLRPAIFTCHQWLLVVLHTINKMF